MTNEQAQMIANAISKAIVFAPVVLGIFILGAAFIINSRLSEIASAIKRLSETKE